MGVPSCLDVWYSSTVGAYYYVVGVEYRKDELASLATISEVAQNRSRELTQLWEYVQPTVLPISAQNYDVAARNNRASNGARVTYGLRRTLTS